MSPFRLSEYAGTLPLNRSLRTGGPQRFNGHGSRAYETTSAAIKPTHTLPRLHGTVQARLTMQRSPLEPLVARLALRHTDDDDLSQRLASLFEAWAHVCFKCDCEAAARWIFSSRRGRYRRDL